MVRWPRVGTTADVGEDGLEPLRAALRANPRSSVFVALAHRLCDLGRQAEAEAICREGLRHQPDLVTGQVALGRVLFERGRLRDAEEALLGAARRDPDHGDTWRLLGEIRLKRGDSRRARVMLEHAETVLPGDQRVSELLVQAGGTPSFRSARPPSDFEHTKISNSRALALTMNADEASMTDESPPQVARARPPSADASGAAAPRSGSGPVPLAPSFKEPVSQADPASLDDPTIATPGLVMPVGDPERAPRAPVEPPRRGPSPAPGRRSPRPPPTMGPSASRATLASFSGVLGQAPAAHEPPRGRARFIIGGAMIAVAAVWGLRASMKPSSGTPGGRARSLMADLAGASVPRLEALVAAARADGAASREVVETALWAQAILLGDNDMGGADDLLRAAESARVRGASPLALVGAEASAALARGEAAVARRWAERALVGVSGVDELPVRHLLARAAFLDGDLDAAGKNLEIVLARAPDYGPAVLDWATLWFERGDAGSAVESLRAFAARFTDHTRAALMLREAALGAGFMPDAAAARVAGCARPEVARSSVLSALCAIDDARRARLFGSRADAEAAARTLGALTPRNPVVRATAVLVLDGLGATDAARAMAQPLSATSNVPRVMWARAAIALDDAQDAAPTSLTLPPFSVPETRLVAARSMWRREGAAGLLTWMRKQPPVMGALDPDLRAWGPLARPRAPASELSETEHLASTGNPVAAYALGARAWGLHDARTALRWLPKAVTGHASACEAARDLTAAARTVGRRAAAFPELRAFHAADSRCALGL